MRKNLDIPDSTLRILEKDADHNHRKIKAHLEYILINYSNMLPVDGPIKNDNSR